MLLLSFCFVLSVFAIFFLFSFFWSRTIQLQIIGSCSNWCVPERGCFFKSCKCNLQKPKSGSLERPPGRSEWGTGKFSRTNMAAFTPCLFLPKLVSCLFLFILFVYSSLEPRSLFLHAQGWKRPPKHFSLSPISTT